MNNCKKLLFNFVFGLIVTLLTLTTASAATEFYLSTNDIINKIHCDYVSIKSGTVECSDKKIKITYDLDAITGIEVSYKGKSYILHNFPQDTINKINTINSEKKELEKKGGNNRIGPAGYIPHESAFTQRLSSVGSFSDVANLFRDQYEKSGLAGIAGICLSVIGLIISVAAGIWYIITTFRVGILWGLSCLFLPFVSLIFLFVYWKEASKPFFLSILSAILIFLGMLIQNTNGKNGVIANSPQSSLLKKVSDGNNFSCNGKIYCSEMTSCAEAEFYLRNCPGTKLDGDGNGIPCESQWCGH